MATKRPIVNPSGLTEHIDADELRVGAGVLVAEGAAPATPSTGATRIYVKTDGKVYCKNDAGVEFDLTASGLVGIGSDFYLHTMAS